MTSFAEKVYKAVLTIPLGEVRSYKWVAQRAGVGRAYQAVGQVLKRNPYPLIIPCHRVIKNNNKIGGYVFGVKQKKLLLELESKLARCLTG
ncbi:MAG: MGMT family protein [Candidatus Omnitrophica bacterium]|jgi:methylated-DNA-[protein]-cysteine S-methyltransferase|nr:MGMT family protein [Candidatus Omnitrophota bacterium]